MKVLEQGSDILAYLQKRQLVSAYQKAKRFLELGQPRLVQLKKRQPKSSNIYQFRIDGQYRALAKKIQNTLVVFHISDHQ